MDFKGLDEWRREMNFSIAEACDELGITWSIWDGYRRRNQVPRNTALACTAIFHRLAPWGEPVGAERKKRTRRVSEASLANLKRGKR